MKSPRWIVNAAMMLSLALLVPATLPSRLAAQGVTTGAISGTVTDAAGKPVENAQVQITNRNTGFRSGALSRANGYYYVQGLEVGGPYTVSGTHTYGSTGNFTITVNIMDVGGSTVSTSCTVLKKPLLKISSWLVMSCRTPSPSSTELRLSSIAAMARPLR